MNCWMVTDLGIITNMTLDYHDDDDEYWIMTIQQFIIWTD
jgi:uncharacterized metal-binding protein